MKVSKKKMKVMTGSMMLMMMMMMMMMMITTLIIDEGSNDVCFCNFLTARTTRLVEHLLALGNQ